MRFYPCIGLLIGACGRLGFDAVDARPDTSSGPALVQEITNTAENVSSLTATLAMPPASGDVLIVVGTSEQGVITDMSGGGVATWTRATISNTACNAEIWYGVSAGSDATVSIGDNLRMGEMWLNVSDWSGLDGSSPLDTASSTGGVTGLAGTGGITTTHAADLLLLAVADHAPNTFGPPSPGTWTEMTSIGGLLDCTQAQWYRVVDTTGTYDPQVAVTETAWDGAIAALRIEP